MKIYIASNIPIGTLREKYSQDPPADFLLEDLIELSQRNDTCFLDNMDIALSKIKNNKYKFIYEVEINEVEIKEIKL